MQMRRLIMTMFCLLPTAALMYGCGSSSKSGGTLSSVATVGDTACVQCHSAVVDKLTGESIITQYQKSAHYYADQGCESCHGGGAQHNGVGPIPYPSPDAARCATCHDGVTAVATNSTEYVNSNHALLDLHYNSTSTDPTCLRCHSDEGAVLFGTKGITGDKTFLTTTAVKDQIVLDRDGTQFGAINCQTCHEHGGVLRVSKAQDATGTSVVAWDPNKNFKFDQFDLCTSCHTYLANDGTTLVASGNGTKPFFHNDRWNRMIATTHYDDPATTTKVEGYVIRTKGANPCFDCHGHEAKTATGSATESTIYTDWAKSGHAGGLLTAKLDALALNPTRNNDQVDAIMAAGADTADASWAHYDWDLTFVTNNATPNANDRGYCQKCHTATGNANFLNSPTAYVQSGKNNSFSHLAGWTAATATAGTVSSGQNELLTCWGCHTNAGTGALRNPGALTVTYDADKTVPFTVTLPDAGKSNVCVGCHSGRGNMNSVAVTRNGSAYHHGVAAGTLYSSVTHTGFEFAGKDYANKSYFAHNVIGAADGAGPCASCHMGGKSHSFKAVDEATSTIKNQALCNTCHTAEHGLMTYVTVEEEKAGYVNAGLLLTDMVANTVVNYSGAAILYTAAGNDYKAFQNSKLTSDEPGGFVHNRIYVKRLIFDSIDALEVDADGRLDGTITIPAGYAEARAWFGADATTGVVAARP